MLFLYYYGTNNNNIISIYVKRHKVRGTSGSRLCVLVIGLNEIKCFSLDLNTDSESLPTTDTESGS